VQADSERKGRDWESCYRDLLEFMSLSVQSIPSISKKLSPECFTKKIIYQATCIMHTKFYL